MLTTAAVWPEACTARAYVHMHASKSMQVHGMQEHMCETECVSEGGITHSCDPGWRSAATTAAVFHQWR